jgi:hypothetical protein
LKSEGSLFGCLAFVSVSVFAMVCAYQFGKYHRRTDAPRTSPPPQNNMVALKDGQTILAVSDTTKVMRFYIGHDARESKE